MNTRDKIRFNTMLEQALYYVKDPEQQDDLCLVACVVSNADWKFWHSRRPPEDNRKEHEWVVFANVMQIAEDEKLTLSEKRIATAFTFTHDSFFIPRIMEQSLRDASDEKKQKLKDQKEEQRKQHMDGGAKKADFLLGQLTRPDSPSKLLFTRKEIRRSVAIVKKHDMWKLDGKSPPRSIDRLALTCLEGDALWPLHPLGVLADLERPDETGKTKDFSDPEVWRTQVEQSLKTLTGDFRPKWTHIPKGDFKDTESIFRTQEGHRLFKRWRKRWNLYLASPPTAL